MPLETKSENETPRAKIVGTEKGKLTFGDRLKLSAMVTLITVLLVLVGLNFREKQPVDLIVGKIYVWPSLTIMVSFALGAGCTLLVMFIRKARKR